MVKQIKGFFLSLLIRISIALKNVEEDLKANVDDLFGGHKIQYKKRHSNPVLRRMEDGTRDENYMQQFYEVLKKADEFVRSANPDKAAKVADRYGMNIGAKDKWGVRWDHHGFLDPKHKHYGKTLKEIRDLEIQERKLKDDDYPIVTMFTNKSELSFVQATKILHQKEDSFQVPELAEMATKQKFPLMVVRKENVVNRIEQLTEFVHIKGITSKHFIIECFIPSKYGLKKYDENSDVFKQLITADQMWFTDDYGDKHAYRITSFYKRTKHIEYVENNEEKYRFDVIKFKAEIIEKI
jgi:hypothetical protein